MQERGAPNLFKNTPVGSKDPVPLSSTTLETKSVTHEFLEDPEHPSATLSDIPSPRPPQMHFHLSDPGYLLAGRTFQILLQRKHGHLENH